MIRCLLIGFLYVFSLNAFAATHWEIIPEQSSLTFTATQNGSPLKGEFKVFSGEINFDPGELNTSKIHIVVDMNSVTTSYKDIETILKTPDWFNIKLFPQATFDSTKIMKKDNRHYLASGTLTIRDKTLPIQLTFTLDEFSEKQAHATGEAQLQRTAFGIGQGEWATTDAVRDEVTVNFVITANK